jgi:tRNA(Arg) A34 adenosine deaminase TadA
MDEHITFIRETIALARAAAAAGNEPFGALLVKAGQVILRAQNTVYSGNDITQHAETNLVRLALAEYDEAFLNDCTLYTSTEPCAMCAGAIFWSGIGRVVYGCSEKRLGEIAGPALDVPCREVFGRASRPVEVIGPVAEDEAAQVHVEYWQSHNR